MKSIILSIDNILLSLDNPRLDVSMDQENVIKKMIENQGNKIFELAKDISQNGLNPIEDIAVTPFDNGQFIVHEGNRRITAIKLLNNPETLKNLDQTLYNKFNNLCNKENKKITSIEVKVFSNDDDLDHWIELKHLGSNNGVGTDKWDSIQKERYTKSKTGKSLLLDFFDKLLINNILNDEEIQSITKTNWERVLTKSGLNFLQLEKKYGEYIFPNDLELFTAKIKMIHKEISNQPVEVVYNEEKRIQLFDKISLELIGKPFASSVSQSTLFEEESKIDNFPKETNLIENEKSQVSTQVKNSSTKIKRDVFENCKTIIPPAYKITSFNTRINKIIKELKYLDVDYYPNACGTLLRLLFELSAKNYIENNQIQINQTIEEIEFNPVIQKAANHMREVGRLDNQLHSALMRDINSLRLLFNGYMHNPSSYPSSTSLKSIFIAHKKFLEECQK